MSDAPKAAELSLTLGSILQFAFTTGVVTAFFNQAFALLKEVIQSRRADKRSGKVLALKLIDTLTDYAQQCNHLAKYNRYIKNNGGYGSDLIPELPPYDSSDAGWSVLRPGVASSVRDFRNDVSDAKHAVEETNEALDPPEAIETATYRLVYLGVRACKLSNKLRNTYGLPRYSGDASFYQELASHYKAYNASYFYRMWNSLLVHRWRQRIKRLVRRVFPEVGRR